MVIEVPGPTEYIDVPEKYTQDCVIPLPVDSSLGALYDAYENAVYALLRCNSDKQAIRQRDFE